MICSSKPSTTVRAVAGIGLLAVLAHHSPTQHQEQLIGVRKLVERIEKNDPEAKIERAEEAFNSHLRALAANGDRISARQAAAEWLALVDEAVAIPQRSFSGVLGGSPPIPPVTLRTALISLPPPDSWPEIRTMVNQRPPSSDRTALQMLCARLLGDNEEVVRLCDEYDRLALPRSDEYPAGMSGTTFVRLATLRRLGRTPSTKALELSLVGNGPRIYTTLYLGDLLPEPQARAFLLGLLKKGESLDLLGNSRNYRLAQQVVLDHLDQFPKPRWSLVNDWNDRAYLSKLVARYGIDALLDSPFDTQVARKIYFQVLALKQDVGGAARVVTGGTNTVAIAAEEWAVVPPGLDRFIASVQARLSHTDLTALYVSAAIAAHHIPEAVGRLEAQVASPKTSRSKKVALLRHLVALHTRVGDLDGVIADFAMSAKIRLNQDEDDPALPALSLGLATGDKRLLNFGMSRGMPAEYGYEGSAIFESMILQGRLIDLERLQIKIARARVDSGELDSAGRGLCAIYYRANRPNEVLDLLRDFRWWSADDLLKFASSDTQGSTSDDRSQKPTAFYAAWAFARTGQKTLALRTLRALLLGSSQGSAAYDLLNGIGDAKTLAIYSDLILARPYDATTHLWEGDLLFRLGRIAEAESSVKRAIAINPAEGFRYRAKLQGLFGQILMKKGDRVGASRCTKLVEAIGLASRANDLFRAGVFSTATATMYRAVALSPDDAALQIQLVGYLQKECRGAEASQHAAIALQHLDTAIGEKSEVAANILRQKLTVDMKTLLDRLVKLKPASAGAYFARGVLHSEAGRLQEAITDFRRTVNIDPQHATAWERLTGLSGVGLTTPAEAEETALRWLDFAPFAESGFFPLDLDAVSNLSSVYLKLKRGLDALPLQEETSILPLHFAGSRRSGVQWPRLMPFQKSARFTGACFQIQQELDMIAGLFHVTKFPFG